MENLMSLLACADCSTQYAMGLDACPHCGSGNRVTEEGVVVSQRLPTFVSLSCTNCGRGPWNVRMNSRMPGLVEIPNLFCASCGSQVQVPWPPVEDSMPKITKHGGPTNVRDEAPSPVVVADPPLAGAEADQGHFEPPLLEATPGEELPEIPAEAYAADATPLEPVETIDAYEDMSLSELRTAAEAKGLPSYGTKSQLKDRLREAE